MNRCFSEIEIARYLEGDLNRKWMTRVDLHLQSCAACCALVEDFRQTQQRLKQYHPPVISEGMTSLVRRQVIDQVRSLDAASHWRRRMEVALFQTSGLRYVGITTVFVLVAALWLWPVRPAQQDSVSVVDNVPSVMQKAEVQVAKSLIDVPPERAAKPKSASARPKSSQPRKDAETPAEVQQITVKLLTDDPDVVIYWLFDSDGGQQL